MLLSLEVSRPRTDLFRSLRIFRIIDLLVWQKAIAGLIHRLLHKYGSNYYLYGLKTVLKTTLLFWRSEVIEAGLSSK